MLCVVSHNSLSTAENSPSAACVQFTSILMGTLTLATASAASNSSCRSTASVDVSRRVFLAATKTKSGSRSHTILALQGREKKTSCPDRGSTMVAVVAVFFRHTDKYFLLTPQTRKLFIDTIIAGYATATLPAYRPTWHLTRKNISRLITHSTNTPATCEN